MTFVNWLWTLVPIALWMGFWLWAVNWKKVWPVLGEGAWAPCVLLMLIIALVWSRLVEQPCTCLGIVTVPNFWWQLGEVLGLACLALFSGWLQSVLHYTPIEVAVEPPADHGHAHDHGHGHEHAADHGHHPDHGHH